MFLLSVVLLVSCSKSVTSYQVFNNSIKQNYASDPYLNGDMYEVVVFCYAGTDVVREDSYNQISCGEKTVIKEVPSSITKIKISYKFLPAASPNYSMSSNYRRYVVSYTLIEQEKNVIAEVNSESMISGSMSIKSSLDSVSNRISSLK